MAVVTSSVVEEEKQVGVLKRQLLGTRARLGEIAAREARQQLGRGIGEPVGESNAFAQAAGDAGFRTDGRLGDGREVNIGLIVRKIGFDQEGGTAVQLGAQKLDATLGLAFARTGALYPFFGTLIGWLGTASTGSDTSANVLFGSLQTMTSRQIGVSPILMASANASGGVMGKMIAAPSVVVASTATGTYGQEGTILRIVFMQSLALAALVGVFVYLMAYVPPFTGLVAR